MASKTKIKSQILFGLLIFLALSAPQLAYALEIPDIPGLTQSETCKGEVLGDRINHITCTSTSTPIGKWASYLLIQPPTPCRDVSCRSFALGTAHMYIYMIINFILGMLGFFLFAAYVYAAILWMSSAGEEEGVTKAKKIIIEATIGLVIVLLSYLIIKTVISLSPTGKLFGKLL